MIYRAVLKGVFLLNHLFVFTLTLPGMPQVPPYVLLVVSLGKNLKGLGLVQLPKAPTSATKELNPYYIG